MKYLFVIQGEGRGHMTQAISLASMLRHEGHEVVEVLVGECSNRELPQFFVDKIGAPVVRYKSPALDYGRKGKESKQGKIWRSIFTNTQPKSLIQWIKSTRLIYSRIKKVNPDVVVNFYELLMGVTALIHRINPPIISIAHQFMLEHPDYKHKAHSVDSQAMMLAMNNSCGFGSKKILALSLYPLPPYRKLWRNITVVPPLLRSEIFELEPTTGDFILGYMLNPGFVNDILDWKRKHPEVKIHLFWDKKGEPDHQEIVEGLWLHRINDKLFIEYMASSAGYITTAGFESVCEAFYLGKPVMMIPAHIEQQINADDAAGAGVGIVSKVFDVERLANYIPQHQNDNDEFKCWVRSSKDILLRELTNI